MNPYEMAAQLRKLGWHVSQQGPRRITPSELARLAGVHVDTVSRKLQHRLCPSHDAETGPMNARIQSVAYSVELVEFMRPRKARNPRP